MNGSNHPLFKNFTAILTVALVAGLSYLLIHSGNLGQINPTQDYIDRKLAKEEESQKQLEFELVDPANAPEPIKDLAILGFNIMVDTKRQAPEYVGNQLSCTNCHFGGGNTTGGWQGGISLAGVATKYPNFDPAVNKVVDLPARINNCFLKSMNGKALPLDSRLMLALVTYFQWISKNLKVYVDVPWLNLKLLNSDHIGDPYQGKKIYDIYCSLCHQEEQKGKIFPPPLFGDDSFNDGAGLSKIPKLSSFIYWNMPYNEDAPILTEEEAIDVASYILTEPRPHYNP